MADEKVLLNDDDLDQVAGGTLIQSYRDFDALQDMGAISQNVDPNCKTVTQTFAKYGVVTKDNGGIIEDNKYFIGGKEVTSTQALEHVRKEINKSLK